VAATNALKRALAASIRPASSSAIASPTIATASAAHAASLAGLATLLHARDVAASSGALAASPVSPQGLRFLARIYAPDRSDILRENDRTPVRLPAPPQLSRVERS